MARLSCWGGSIREMVSSEQHSGMSRTGAANGVKMVHHADALRALVDHATDAKGIGRVEVSRITSLFVISVKMV
jgi:hypothetical protein